uniref:Cilia and flagella associated protein 221 n=1 Tax=Astyanax mexicanus TaxID=7994 RepID=W5KPP9_ASTMX
MEVVLQASAALSKSEGRRSSAPPLRQLLEESRRTGSQHLLPTRVYVKFRSNNKVEVDPLELHFRGFEVGRNYKKVLKLINISSDVLDVHILPTQTKYFHTEYTKKNRLVPGLSYTITVRFSPDEWRYFYDSIRVHCQGEENLLVPVHAYPVIDDLHIPSHIYLPAVPLGHSIAHVIPLSCSCPIDFEFQVHCLQPHEAFTIQPLSGVIPANGKTDFTVTFRPDQYGTAEITLQLLISQFNSKPFVCTLTASCSPQRTRGQPGKNEKSNTILQDRKPEVLLSLPADRRIKLQRFQHKKKIKPDDSPQSSAVDVSTPAGLAKMLLQPHDKLSYKLLREAMSHTQTAHQTRQMKEASLENKVQFNVQKERVNHLQWQVNLGELLSSTEQKMKILQEQEFAAAEYKAGRDSGGREADFNSVLPKLSLHRVQRNAEQTPHHLPAFSVNVSSQLEVRQRLLRLFQQAAYKVILQCRMKNRLLVLQQLASNIRKKVEGHKGTEPEEKTLLKMSPEKLLSCMSPSFTPTDQQDQFAVKQLGHVSERTFRSDLTTSIPFFSLKFPQHYRLMGYQEVSVYDAGASFINSKLCRPLRTGAQDELLPTVMFSAVELCEEKELQQEEELGSEFNNPLSFTAPENLINPVTAQPLRIFNPAPSLFAYKPTPHPLETDPELPAHPASRGSITGNKDIIKGIMVWKKFPSMALTLFSNTSLTSSNWASRRSDPFSSSVLPLEAPPPLSDLPHSIREETLSGATEGTGVSLTPEMVLAEFTVSDNSPPKPAKEDD